MSGETFGKVSVELLNLERRLNDVLRAENERLRAQNNELLEERQRLLDELFKQPALALENDRLRAAIKWTQEVRPIKNQSGRVIVRMTRDEFDTMRALSKGGQKPLTTEDLDLLQFGRVLHKRPEQGEKG